MTIGIPAVGCNGYSVRGVDIHELSWIISGTSPILDSIRERDEPDQVKADQELRQGVPNVGHQRWYWYATSVNGSLRCCATWCETRGGCCFRFAFYSETCSMRPDVAYGKNETNQTPRLVDVMAHYCYLV